MHNEEYFYIHGKDVYSVQSLLVSLGVKQEDSIYKDSANDFVRWPFTAGDFFEAVSNTPAKTSGTDSLLNEEEKAELEKINAEIKGYKDSGNTIANQDRIKELRILKKQLMEKSSSGEEKAKTSILYKNSVVINDSKTVEKKLPQFKNVKWPFREQMPYFTAGLEDFAQAVKKGEPTAITGGPCFFGEHEVDMILSLNDGSEIVYDFTTSIQRTGNGESRESEFARNYASKVVDVSFKSHKNLLTTEEYDSILYLFELANACGSCLTVPIVDASYEKYLSSMFSTLSEEIQRRAHERFRKLASSIISLYRELFEFFKKKYPDVKCVMMTGEDTELLQQYYTKRSFFIEKPSSKRDISNIQERYESVKDYITLPALPFYLLGIKNVLEVDYLGEADSFRKCRRMHKGELNLSALLYPIKISADGWRNIFQTELKYKEYVARNDYGKR